jgi:hypothetical protein
MRVQPLAKRTGAKASEILQENVGLQLLSLRHFVRVQYSPQAFVPVQIRNYRGPSHKDLRTAMRPSTPQILSLGPFVSKPPDSADLVRIS